MDNITHLRPRRPIALSPAEVLVVNAVEVIMRYLPPDSGISSAQAFSDLIELFDSPDAWDVYQSAIERGQSSAH